MNHTISRPPLLACLLSLAPLAIPAHADFNSGPKVKTTVLLRDDDGNPVANAETRIAYLSVAPNTHKVFQEQSGAEGRVEATAQLKGSIKIDVRKNRYYPVTWPKFRIKGLWDGDPSPTAEIVMRQVENPTALYAKKVELSVPVFGQWVGYDFQEGDWLAPHGQGRVADVDFRASQKFEGFHLPEEDFRGGINADVSEERLRFTYGNWTGELQMRVPSEGGGIITEKEGYQVFTSSSLSVHYSGEEHWEMRMPHLAPEQGYQQEPLVWKGTYPSPMPPEEDPMIGYFLRTRANLDEEGNVVSANYAKIMTSDAHYHGSDIHFDPRGKISFTYYFNPTANDRNLEFDPEKNLFPDLEREEQVRLP